LEFDIDSNEVIGAREGSEIDTFGELKKSIVEKRNFKE